MMKRALLALVCLTGVARAQSIPTPTLPGQPANKGYVDATSLTAVTNNADVQFAHLFGQTFYSGAINGFQDGLSHTLIGTYGTLAAAVAKLGCTKAVTGNETVDWCVVDAAFERGKAIASTGPEAGTSLFGGPKGVKIDLPGRIAHYDMGCTPLAVDDMSFILDGSGVPAVELGWSCPLIGAMQVNLHATQPKSGQSIIRNVAFMQYGAAGGVPLIAAFNNVGTNLILENNIFAGASGLQTATTPVANVQSWANGPIIINANDARANANYLRAWPGIGHTGTAGIPDPQVVSSTSNSITLTRVPANTLVGENLTDMTLSDNIPDGCVVTSVSGTTLGTSCPVTVAVNDYVMISSWGLNFFAPAVSPYYPTTLGHFGINVQYNKMLGFPSGGAAFFANGGQGIQGVRFLNNGVGNADRMMSFYNARGVNEPSIEVAFNQAQVDEDGLFCEQCSQVNFHDNKWYVGAGTSAPHPLPIPNVAFMDVLSQGNTNMLAHNVVSAYPGSPALVGAVQTTDNHDTFDSNVFGQGTISPIGTVFQFPTGAANQTEGLDAIYQTRTLTANATSAAGSNTITLLEANAGSNNSWTAYPGLAIDDATNVLALPGGCKVQSVSGQVITLQSGCAVNTGQTIASGDTIVLTAAGVDEKSNWMSVSATSNAGSSILYFEPRYMLPGIAVGMAVSDLINMTAITPGTTITSVNFTTGQVGLSIPLVGTVSAGDSATVAPDVIDFDGTIPGGGIMSVAPVEARLYDSSANYLIADNFNNVAVNPNGNFAHLIKLPNLPRRGQLVTVTDEAGIANLYPFTLVGTINVGTTPAQTNITNDCINGVVSVRWTGNGGWVLQNYVCYRSGPWTPVVTDNNVGDGLVMSAVTSSGTYSATVEPTGKCNVRLFGTYTGTPTYTAGVGTVNLGGLPIGHDSGSNDDLFTTGLSAFTWPNASTQLQWETVGTSTNLVLRGLKSGAASSGNTLTFSGLTSGSPVTLGVTGMYRANGC